MRTCIAEDSMENSTCLYELLKELPDGRYKIQKIQQHYSPIINETYYARTSKPVIKSKVWNIQEANDDSN